MTGKTPSRCFRHAAFAGGSRPCGIARVLNHDIVLVFFNTHQQVFSQSDHMVQSGEIMQFIDSCCHRGDNVDTAKEKHEGKNAESKNNFFLHAFKQKKGLA